MGGALELRAQRARDEARQLIMQSRCIVASRRLLADPESVITRCAWCGRLALGGAWMPVDEIPVFVNGRLEGQTTHGICLGCIDRLEREGKSRPRDTTTSPPNPPTPRSALQRAE